MLLNVTAGWRVCRTIWLQGPKLFTEQTHGVISYSLPIILFPFFFPKHCFHFIFQLLKPRHGYTHCRGARGLMPLSLTWSGLQATVPSQHDSSSLEFHSSPWDGMPTTTANPTEVLCRQAVLETRAQVKVSPNKGTSLPLPPFSAGTPGRTPRYREHPWFARV